MNPQVITTAPPAVVTPALPIIYDPVKQLVTLLQEVVFAVRNNNSKNRIGWTEKEVEPRVINVTGEADMEERRDDDGNDKV
ncbi:22968_t:CDS:2, partial [Gigaspora rosea]